MEVNAHLRVLGEIQLSHADFLGFLLRRSNLLVHDTPSKRPIVDDSCSSYVTSSHTRGIWIGAVHRLAIYYHTSALSMT